MAGKNYELADAAARLGVTPEQLVEMRSKGEIFGVRNGSSWEFKPDEVERVLAERGGADEGSATSDSIAFDSLFDDLDSGSNSDDQDSILITDEPDLQDGSRLGSGKGSTVIGQDNAVASADSDIQLNPSSALGSGMGHALDFGSDRKQTGSEILGGSKTGLLGKMAAPSNSESIDSLEDLGLGGDDELLLASDSNIGVPSSHDTGSLADEIDMLSSEDLSLGEDFPSDELQLSDDKGDFDSVLGEEASGSGKRGRSGKGSDITGGGGDSGINLLPSDGGLSLEEEPLDLGGGSVESLELSADDGLLSLEEAADPDQATQLKADDQFMLSPSDAIGEDEPDSGSQVIALEDSEAFEQHAQPALVADDPYAQAGMAGLGAAGMVAGGAMQPGMMPQYGPQSVEAPYTIFQVLTLLVLSGILTLSGMLMVDVVSNMWSWNGTGSASTYVMDRVIDMVGLNK